jgi:hypothetical protein
MLELDARALLDELGAVRLRLARVVVVAVAWYWNSCAQKITA